MGEYTRYYWNVCTENVINEQFCDNFERRYLSYK